VESNPLKLEFVKSIKLQWELQEKRKENKKMGKGKGKSVLTNDKQANTTSKRGKYK